MNVLTTFHQLSKNIYRMDLLNQKIVWMIFIVCIFKKAVKTKTKLKAQTIAFPVTFNARHFNQQYMTVL